MIVLPGHGHEAHIILWVGSCLGMTDEVDSILLSLQSGGYKVSISHEVTVVHTENTTHYMINFAR